MNKYLFMLISIFICTLLVAIGCSCHETVAETEKSGKMIINGVKTTSDYIMLYKTENHEVAHIPLTKVFFGLGINFSFIGDDCVDFLYNNKRYVIDLIAKTFGEENVFSVPLLAPGEQAFHYEVKDEEVILNDGTILLILAEIGKKVDLTIDFDNAVVYITDRTD